MNKVQRSIFIINGNKAEKTHDLVLLNSKCSKLEKKFNEIEDECIELVPYDVQVRYPYQLDVNEDDVKSAISSAEKIEAFIQKILR